MTSSAGSEARPTLRSAYIAWLATCLIWGTTYLGIKVALETMPPWLMAAMRWIAAGGVMMVVLRIRGQRLPDRSAWPGLGLLSFLLIVVGNGGVVWAEQWVPSGLTAVLVASVPFWMVGVDVWLQDGERVTTRTLAGLLLGFAGIVLLVWPDLRFDDSGNPRFLAGVLALQVASLGWALGSAYSKRRRHVEAPLGAAALQMMFGGLMLLVIGTLAGEWPHFHASARTGAALGYLILFGSIGGFVAYLHALKHLPVATVSLYAYVNPIIAVVLGALLLDEPFGVRMALAAALVFAGMAAVRPAPKAAEAGAGARVPAAKPITAAARSVR